MNPGEGKILQCPKCGCRRFSAVAHVTQEWEIDENGKFSFCVQNCTKVDISPDMNDTISCINCEHSAAATDFVIDAPTGAELNRQRRMCETVFDITRVAEDLIRNEIYVDIDSRELFAKIAIMAVDFENRIFRNIDYLSEVDDYAYRELRKYLNKRKENSNEDE